MTNAKELTNRIRGAGFTFEEISNLLGITRQSFDNKINGKTEFKQGEIAKLRKVLNLNLTATNAIFFDVK